jgi:Ion channel
MKNLRHLVANVSFGTGCTAAFGSLPTCRFTASSSNAAHGGQPYRRALSAAVSTVGYGDLILQPTWRMVGSVEGLTGVLMCGLSASLLFAIVTRLVERDERAELANALALTRAASPTAQIPGGQ